MIRAIALVARVCSAPPQRNRGADPGLPEAFSASPRSPRSPRSPLYDRAHDEAHSAAVDPRDHDCRDGRPDSAVSRRRRWRVDRGAGRHDPHDDRGRSENADLAEPRRRVQMGTGRGGPVQRRDAVVAARWQLLARRQREREARLGSQQRRWDYLVGPHGHRGAVGIQGLLPGARFTKRPTGAGPMCLTPRTRISTPAR